LHEPSIGIPAPLLALSDIAIAKKVMTYQGARAPARNHITRGLLTANKLISVRVLPG